MLVTGAAGDVGGALARALTQHYRVVGLDRPGLKGAIPIIGVDLRSDDEVARALARFRREHGARIASVIHLAAYFDFSGEDTPLYREVNVEGTRRLLRALQDFEVEQFVYAGTMLVHAPAAPGGRIDEAQPIAPKWAYPQSKAAAEEVIRAEHGRIPCVLLHLAGLYDEGRCVPTLAHQIARIYERDLQSFLYAGDPKTGQAMLHRQDMVDAFLRTVERRDALPAECVILVGEPQALSYGELQDRIGRLVHGEAEWTTLSVPKPIAAAGAALQQRLEPVVPDALDRGERPFIRPFMVEMAEDHYALDIGRARRLLGWEPRHALDEVLPAMVNALKRDPKGWYAAQGITPPAWVEGAEQAGRHPDALRRAHDQAFRDAHRRHLWAHFANLGLGAWLAASPLALDLGSALLVASDVVSGLVLALFALLSLSWRLAWARWACAAVGFWVLCAPILFWSPSAAGYLNDTLVGMLAMGFAVGFPPEPGVSPVAATLGPEAPPGWSFNPSSFVQRLPIVALAFVGLAISRTLAAYQLGHLDAVWEPFFAGSPDPRNGTEEIITSSVSQAWPVADGAVGALTYALEIVTGVIGSRRRWRTMPWLVLLFGLMIAPLGIVSVFFIVIQPIWIGTWCTLCLVAAVAMLVQIPYSLDELVASGQFLLRRRRAGQGLLRPLLLGDTDLGTAGDGAPEFERPPRAIVRDMVSGGVGLPWHLGLCVLIGVWLMCTRLTLGADGALANADHLVGSLVITVCAIAAAEVARPLRVLNMLLGTALIVVQFVHGADLVHALASVACGIALVLLSVPRGRIASRYGGFETRLF